MAGGTLPPRGMIDPYGRPPAPGQYPPYQGGSPGYQLPQSPQQQYYPSPQQYQNNAYQQGPSAPQGYQSPYSNQGPTNIRTQSNYQPGYLGPTPPNN